MLSLSSSSSSHDDSVRRAGSCTLSSHGDASVRHVQEVVHCHHDHMVMTVAERWNFGW